jgi:broad specificity phosphatase PhoE
MTRTAQTAIAVFGNLITVSNPTIPVQIWPELREGYDHAPCNRGISKVDLMAKFPFPAWDFERCNEEWDYDAHSFDSAMARAEVVRKELKELADTERYENILLVTHRGFIAFLVQGGRFGTCGTYSWQWNVNANGANGNVEARTYRFANKDEAEDIENRYGASGNAGERQDFGSTVLLPVVEDRENVST